MSVYVMSHVWRHGPEDRTELVVLLAIADFADDDGFCWPSTQRIAEKARLTRRGVQKVIRRLEDIGWLKVEAGGGRGSANRYTVLMGKGEPETANTVRPLGKKRANQSAQRANQSAQRANHRSPEPSITIKEPSEEKKCARDILRQILSKDTADDFIAHRKSLKKPLTVEAANRIVKKLASFSDPEGAVDDSIANGWAGVFPRKGEGNGNSKDGSAAAMAQRVGERIAARRMGGGTDNHASQPLLPARQSGGGTGGGT